MCQYDVRKSGQYGNAFFLCVEIMDTHKLHKHLLNKSQYVRNETV